MKVLVVDDDPSVIGLFEGGLIQEGWQVISALDGEDALQLVEKEMPDIIVLDIMLPRMSGFEVCRQLATTVAIPIVMLSARVDVDDKIKCLNMGADDYVTKPFRIDEMIARIKAILRRHQNEEICAIDPYVSGKLTINFRDRLLTYGNKTIELSNIESKIMRELVSNAPKILPYKYLLVKIWGPENRYEREYLHTFISYLRAKLEYVCDHREIIFSKRNVGYYFIEPDVPERSSDIVWNS